MFLKYSWSRANQQRSYKTSIGSITLKQSDLQETDLEAQKRKQHSEVYKEINAVFYHQSLSFVPEVIKTKITNRQNDNHIVNHFGIEKNYKLMACKYYL